MARRTKNFSHADQLEIAARIQSLVAAADSARDFAARAGLSSGGLSEYQSGKKVPTLATLERIAIAGNVTLEWLVAGNEAIPHPLAAETRDEFIARQRAINTTSGIVDALPISDLYKVRLKAVLTGDPARDGELIAAALQSQIPPDEAALLDNYRHSSEAGREAVRKTAFALAESKLEGGVA
ncbi:MAG: helix-turn-helix domain-containing protein [Azoarcus sp.]|jgi:transcriptional regulator with XRE-family HTH domain|nr:helix-turn-helix domain-containing protein [Azoarcus sp.]